MKKFLAVLAVAGVMISCNNKKNDKAKEGETKDTTTTTTTSTTQDVAPPANTGTPTFSDPDVTAYVKAYEDYLASLKKAVESKDMTKMADLSKAAQELATKGTTAAGKLATSPEDAKKLADYMTAKGNEAAEMMKKLTGVH